MTKALTTLLVIGLLAGTAYVASAQQEQSPPAQQQRPSADDVFARLDSDGDGKLNLEEFSQALAGQATEEQAKQQFSEWDTNGDDGISKQEFAAKYSPSGSR